MKGLIGKKIGMTQVFNDEGNLVPVTVIDVSTCQVVGKRTPEKDQYSAVTLGFGEIREKILNKCERGFFKKANVPYRRHVKEFRVTVEEATSFNVGDAVKADLFSKGQLVDVTGVTKGRGFSGVMRRWSFKGSQTKTHGTHEYQRHPGAIGQRKTPGRVYPNKKMPGHYGVEQVTTQNLTVVEVDLEKGLVLVKGAVPGHNNAIVFLRPSIKVAMREQHKAARRG
ncbi:50S ribosomal protein L3 [Myxococcus sp. CA051A]|uniref:Large ribosomal subunit protein uL3 n=1 Tax=Myxococcus llanfairpwllgwyngyllgogerychwyrndrobwllllantysiliogogogochensis TaxID=2590453 RepID=A0A540WT95_9BACT|nr:50S ribosomal protein L3 [Myxococcus llanfairpwllgwyngyllgogerychwyrndrobwllllantysiliogogogochensis]NTX08188.1 50S ribosomal protein L3 [Myxococcus sp. CA040A]NTX13582.1 50S ribosomal protein L3 [Myxococcus sp. CA056]NTX38878.1 50S ribosomal protein L3 [Myxococcus sp. CA033]NTX53849.1 50S ribosomal protein L3 [Myxococcus sp. CA039A]NTX67394.1 50S ribosomal protein L3 [Myxococcus sp. CA051A]